MVTRNMSHFEKCLLVLLILFTTHVGFAQTASGMACTSGYQLACNSSANGGGCACLKNPGEFLSGHVVIPQTATAHATGTMGCATGYQKACASSAEGGACTCIKNSGSGYASGGYNPLQKAKPVAFIPYDSGARATNSGIACSNGYQIACNSSANGGGCNCIKNSTTVSSIGDFRSAQKPRPSRVRPAPVAQIQQPSRLQGPQYDLDPTQLLEQKLQSRSLPPAATDYSFAKPVAPPGLENARVPASAPVLNGQTGAAK